MHRTISSALSHTKWAAVVAVGIGAGVVNAEPMQQDVDMAHTAVYFAAKHGDFANVRGLFRTINSVEFVFDRDNVENSSVKAEIDAASIDTNHDYRDNYLRSEAFFGVIENPLITFESMEIKKTGDNTGTMTGNLTLKGVTKPVTLDVVYNKGGPHVSGQYDLDGFTATGTINRLDFGVSAFHPWINEMVELQIDLEAKR